MSSVSDDPTAPTGNATPKETGNGTPSALDPDPDATQPAMASDQQDVKPEYIAGSRLAIIMATIMLSTLLGALDIVGREHAQICTGADILTITSSTGHSRHRHPGYNGSVPRTQRRRLVWIGHLPPRRHVRAHVGQVVQIL